MSCKTPLFKTTHLLYLHGFRSSPLSMKSQKMAARVRGQHPGVTWWCPQLPPSPQAAMDAVMQGTTGWPRERMAVVGSSLGGFYARWVALQTGCRAVLLNPAPHPARDLAAYIGEQTAWHDPQERFFFQPEFVDELKRLEADLQRLGAQHPNTPERLMAVIAQGDELLDWREMQAFSAEGLQRMLRGSDHALSDFDAHLDVVMDFLDLSR
jgi:predicted esterase YcpF (UPF0227 family)